MEMTQDTHPDVPLCVCTFINTSCVTILTPNCLLFFFFYTHKDTLPGAAEDEVNHRFPTRTRNHAPMHLSQPHRCTLSPGRQHSQPARSFHTDTPDWLRPDSIGTHHRPIAALLLETPSPSHSQTKHGLRISLLIG